jgi:hypothetical protein
MGWPPQVGELLPRADEAIGVRQKLETYSLDLAHEDGVAKALGFAQILGITLASVDYLEAEIRRGVQANPISEVRRGSPFGLRCVVTFPLRGIGVHRERAVPLRTVWEFATPLASPRLVTAFLKP